MQEKRLPTLYAYTVCSILNGMLVSVTDVLQKVTLPRLLVLLNYVSFHLTRLVSGCIAKDWLDREMTERT